MVSENDIGTLCVLIFMSSIIQVPPLYIETKCAFVEEEKNKIKIKKVGEEGIFLGNYD